MPAFLEKSWKTREIGRAHFREKGVFVIPIAMRWQILVKLASVMLYEWQGGNCPNLSPGTLRLKGRLDENNPDMLTESFSYFDGGDLGGRY